MLSQLEGELKPFTHNAVLGGGITGSIGHVQYSSIDFLKINRPLDVKLEGLWLIQENDHKRWRWGLGPSTSLKFSLFRPQTLILRVAFESPFEEPSVVLKHNDMVMVELEGSGIEQEVVIQAKEHNTIAFEYADWNKSPKHFPNDPRPIATSFSFLALGTADGGPFLFPSEPPLFPYVGSPVENEDLARREYARARPFLAVSPHRNAGSDDTL